MFMMLFLAVCGTGTPLDPPHAPPVWPVAQKPGDPPPAPAPAPPEPPAPAVEDADTDTPPKAPEGSAPATPP